MNPYDVLEIKPGASFDEIKAAYHRLAKQWHPDRFTGEEKAKAEEKFRLLAEAFSSLKEGCIRQESESRSSEAPPKSVPQSAPPSGGKPPQEKTPADWMSEAKEAVQANDFARGLALVHHVLRMDGDMAEAHVLLAHLIDATGGDKRAKIKALENAIRLNPKDADSMLYLADAYQLQGMQSRAARIREDARQVAPKHPYFSRESKPKSSSKEAVKKEVPQTLGEQLSALLGRFFRKG